MAVVAMIPANINVAGFVLSGRPSLGLRYDDFHRDGYIVLIVLSVGRLTYAWTGSCEYTLMMTGHQRLMMYIALVVGLIAIGPGVLRSRTVLSE